VKSEASNERRLSPETEVVSAGRPAVTADGNLNPAISLNSTFHAGGPVGYGRYGNESWTALESGISALEGGQTLLYSSGMAAINAIFNLLPKGAVVTASKNGYTGTMLLLAQLVQIGKIETRLVDISDTDEVLAALPGTALLWIESPTNPALEVADLPTIIKAGKSAGAGVGVDNTFATPLLQQPLSMGADMVMHSVTKYIAGHSDLVMGSVSTNDVALYNRLNDARKLAGSVPGPFEAWLALRGLRTLSVRMERAQANALELATRLSSHPAVEHVRYPGLPSDPHHARAKSFMKGFGAVISFEVKGGASAADKACESSTLITYATSLGGVESLWERRHRWSAESPTIPTNLVRLSVGIENVDDLWADIEQALKKSQG
jgi:cystathionine gamma-synthase